MRCLTFFLLMCSLAQAEPHPIYELGTFNDGSGTIGDTSTMTFRIFKHTTRTGAAQDSPIPSLQPT